ncbi:MAG: ComEC/Rec2 family competence protein [Albidovulum sp.]
MRGPGDYLREGLLALASARGTMLPWAPVFFALGVGLYFALPVEPGIWPTVSAVFAVICLTALALRGADEWRIPATGMGLIIAGLLFTILRAHSVEAPVLSFRYYGPVEGRIVAVDRSFSDRPRMTLDRVVLRDVPPNRTPSRVRVALHGDQTQLSMQPGMTVILTAHLSPPEGPVEPGGFDFQRLAWFSSLGAVGYTRTPVLELEPAEGGLALLAFRLRMTLSTAIQDAIPGQPGAFAAALMTGDRSGVAKSTHDILRGSNLSHMIAISGLHMGLLTGFVFALGRYGFALIPYLALRVNSKKVAAIAALLAATFYLFLAGPAVATRRAYIMAAVMLIAVLVDRRAISLRSVAISAMICLMIEPESLVEPGFQMSFGATVALVVGFEHWSRIQLNLPAPLKPVAMAVLSSLIAGTATAPIAAAHFNRIAEYGLLANLLAVPILGFLVMPSAVLAAMLAPLGLAQPALWVAGKGCDAILRIGDWVTNLEGAVIPVPTPPWMVLPLLGFFGAVMMIARGGALRLTGLAGVALALSIWTFTQRPVLLISGDGALVGLMTPEGRALSKEKGGGFIAQNWLENDGDSADQPRAFERAAFNGQKGALTADVGGKPVQVYFGKGSATRAQSGCADQAILIMNEVWEGPSETPDCEVFDLKRLRQTGAIALFASQDGLRMVAAHDVAGNRLWNQRKRARRGK